MSQVSDSEKRSVDLSEEDSDEASNIRKVSMIRGMIAGTIVGVSAWLRA
jgi:hypothetical protein